MYVRDLFQLQRAFHRKRVVKTSADVEQVARVYQLGSYVLALLRLLENYVYKVGHAL